MSWVKVEAVVIRERIETVIDAVEEHAGHVGVTVIEAVGHGRQRGITHEYRGRVFESRFLPKALLVFVAPEERVGRDRRDDRRRRPQRQRVGRRDRLDDPDRERDAQPDRPSAGGSRGGRMSNKDLLYAVSTVWVVIAAVLVMFMQAGFAFLEAGLTRMKNVGHIAAKNVLIFAIASIVYYIVGFGIAFGDGGNGLVGGSGFFPTVDDLMAIGAAPFSWFSEIPGAAGVPVRGRLRRRLARDRLGRDGRADEALGLLRLRDPLHARLLGRLALDLVARRLALREGHAGLRRLDGRPLPGRARRARRRAAARPAHRQVRPGREAERDPGPQHGLHDARRDHPLVRLVRLQPGLDAQRRLRRPRLLRLRRPEHEHRGRRRRARRARRVLARDQEAGHLDDAERRDRRARRDHRGLRVRGAVGGDRDRLRRRRHRRRRRARSSSGSGSTTRSARSPRTAWPASGARSPSAS